MQAAQPERPIAPVLLRGAGLLFLILALVFNEFLMGWFDSNPPLARSTVVGIRWSQLLIGAVGAALMLFAKAARHLESLRSLLCRERVTNALLGALVVGVPLLGAELVLRPFVGPTAVPRAAWDLTIPPKAEGTFRIVAVGGSTIAGFPLERIGVVEQLESWLQHLRPDRPVEVINLGRQGKSARYVRKALDRVLDTDVDLAIVMTGHNEFLGGAHAPSDMQSSIRSILRPSALGRMLYKTTGLLVDGRPTDEVDSGPPATRVVDRAGDEYRTALERFAANVDGIVELARSREVPLILITPPSNVADWPPAQPSDAFQLFSDGLRARTEGRLAASRELLNQARNLDPFPWRATDDFVEIVRDRAGAEGVVLLDMIRAFEDASSDGIIGRELIADNVHPTPGGYSIMARELVAAMARGGHFVQGEDVLESAETRLEAFWQGLGGPDERDDLRIEWLVRTGAYLVGFDLPAMAAAHLEEAVAIDPERWEAWANLGTARLLEDRIDEGQELLSRAEALHGSPLRGHPRVPHLLRALRHARGPDGR